MAVLNKRNKANTAYEEVSETNPLPVEVEETERLALTGGPWGQTIGATAVPLTNPPENAHAAEIYVRTASIVFTRTGTAPTATRGFQADPGDIILLNARSEVMGFRAIRQGATSATIDPEYFSKVAS